MDLINSFLDTIGEVFIKFASWIPSGDNISTSGYFSTISSIKGYINYFIPFNQMATIWNAFVVLISGVIIGFVILKWVRSSFLK